VTSAALQRNAQVWSRIYGGPFVVIGRPGTFGSSGHHGRDRRSALEVKVVMAALDARDRLRLGCYYAQQLTLAQTGKLLKEHEATTSRQLARTRERIRGGVEAFLRDRGLNDVQIARCFECATEDVGATNLEQILEARSG
jgi:hypothetical protein